MNEIQFWAIVDANGRILAGHSDRAALEVELERRVAEDPRLRRVLRLTEHTMQARPRDEAPEDVGEPQTLPLLPWLPLDEPIAMGPMRFDHWSEVKAHVGEPARSTADQLLTGVQDRQGQVVDPVVCYFGDRSPTAHLTSSELDLVRPHIFLLALAGFAENTYFHPAFEPITSAHCRYAFLNFTSKRPTVRTIRRRREGWAQTDWYSSQLRLVRPIAAEMRPTAAGHLPSLTLYRQPFVDALAGCVDGEDPLSTGVRQSVGPFLRGNDMDEYGSADQDVVWLVAALEQLVGKALGVNAGRRGTTLAQSMADLFPGWPRAERTLFRRWVTHLYSKRHEIHGQPSTASGWEAWAHAVLATEFYPLLVKALLAAEGRYFFDPFDVRSAAAFPARIRLVEGAPPVDQHGLGLAWHQTVVDAIPATGRLASTPWVRRETE